MTLLVIFIILLSIILAVWWYSRPEVFARNIAHTQLRSFESLRKYNPELSKEELYIKVFSMRPGYSNDRAHSIVKKIKVDNEGELNLKDVVRTIVINEYTGSLDFSTDISSSKEVKKIVAMIRVINEIIPEEY